MDTNNCLIAVVNLLEEMEYAIASGAWEVDGAHDPSVMINQARYMLRQNGWTQNGIDGSWQKAD